MEETGRREAALDRDLTKGNVTRHLLILSWPMIINGSLYMLGPAYDMIWIGKLGAIPIAGVGVAGMVVSLVQTVGMGLITGARAIIARFVGAGDFDSANYVVRQALVVSTAYGIIMTVPGIILAEPLLRLFGLETDVLPQGVAYLRTFALVWTPMSLYWMMGMGVMMGSGDAVTPLKIIILVRFAHLVICPFVILGWWVFPRLGVSGAALTHLIAESLGMVITLWVLLTGQTRLQLSLKNFRLDGNIIWRIVRIGVPASVMSAQSNFGHMILMWIMARFGTMAIAAHSLGQRVDMVLHMPSWGLSMAAGVLVGQNLGAGQPGRAERSGWLAAGLVEGFMLICSVVILLWAENIIGIFSTEPDLVEIASTFLRIAAVGYLVHGFTAGLQYCITGAGDTLPPMVISLITMWVLQLPLAFFLPEVTNLGVYGVRWAIVSSMVFGAVAYVTYFRLGRWKYKRI